MKLLAVDGNSILNRSFYGVKALTTSAGLPTNAVFGFYNMLNKILREVEPDYIVIAWDLKAPTFRHKQYDLYKANRHGMPEDLAIQLPFVKRMLDCMGICQLSVEGFEADDILGSLSHLCKQKQMQCVIATGDRDSLQLVGEKTKVILSTNRQPIWYDEQKILDEYGVCPPELIEVKALMGDASDNIPGVKGIGQKTAFSLIQNYHSIETVFANIDKLDVTARVKNILHGESARRLAQMSKKLGTIYCDVPISRQLQDYKKRETNQNEMLKLLHELEFKKIAKQYQAEPENKTEDSISIIENPSLEQAKQLLKNQNSLDFILNDGQLFIFTGQGVMSFTQQPWESFCTLIATSKKEKRTTDVKCLYRLCIKHGVSLENVVFSCDIAAYLLNVLERDYSLSSLLSSYMPQGRLPYCFCRLCDVLQTELNRQNMQKLNNEIELPLAEVLACMEHVGFLVDTVALKAFGEQIQLEIEQLTAKIYELAGESFNVNSTKDLNYILFKKLQLPPGKKTKTGFSTDVGVLEHLKKHHPIAHQLLEYRSLSKLYSTYVVGLLKQIDKDGRVHSNFRQTETRTGRISSTEPNMQNIPVKTERGKTMRKFFVAKPGYVLLDADYSQIELRVLAHLSKDPQMIQAFCNNIDIHAATAGNVFGLAPEFVPPELRRRAKTINFGIIYGMGAFSLAKDLHVSVEEARAYIRSYFNTYCGVKKYMDDTVALARQTGKVFTMFARSRVIPEIKSKNHNLKAFGERVARNTPIQGTAADIIKIAMIRVSRRLKQERLDAQLILQVHDELLIEASQNDAQSAATVLKQEMEQAVKLSIPLVADVEQGVTWYDAKH